MKTVTIKLNDKKYIEIKNFYSSSFVATKKGSNIDFAAKQDDLTVTGYINKKNEKTVVFTGNNAEKASSVWKKDALKVTVSEPSSKNNEDVKLFKEEPAPSKKAAFKKENKPVENKASTKKAETKKEPAKKAETKKATPKKTPTKKVEKKTEKKVTTPKKVEKKTEKKATTPANKKEVIKENVKASLKKVEKKTNETTKKVAAKVEPKKEEAKKVINKNGVNIKSTVKNTHFGSWVDIDDQIGSDEVGTGDFFGPIVVVGCYVKKQDMPFLKELGVNDSKKLSDAKIREIAPLLMRRLDFSRLILSNDKYNSLIITNENLNSIKAKLHNRALLALNDKHPEVVGIYVDQFCSKDRYYKYLNNPEERIVKDISFHTQGETIYPSVAAASIIARYSFLLEIDEMNAKYNAVVPLGAGAKVNEFAKEFIAKFGILELNKIVKRNFKNYKEVITGKLL